MLVIASTTGTGEVEIVWYLDLQLLVQSVPITTNSVSSNPVLARRYSIQYYTITALERDQYEVLWYNNIERGSASPRSILLYSAP